MLWPALLLVYLTGPDIQDVCFHLTSLALVTNLVLVETVLDS
jgi:hypothetical protein